MRHEAKRALERLTDDELLALLEISDGLVGEMIDDVMTERIASRVSRDGHADCRRSWNVIDVIGE